MTKQAYHSRAQTLESEFFHYADLHLVAEGKEAHHLEVDEDALAIATGIADNQVIDELLDADVTPKTLLAFSLFPAVFVAWAEGEVKTPERLAILDAAHNQGISKSSPAHQLLETWLEKKPSLELTQAWKDFIHALRPTISGSAFRELREAAVKRAQDVSKTAGGVLGIGSVSSAEKAAIAELNSVFDDAENHAEPAGKQESHDD